ncbi:four helix bundle protein [Nonlabens agnitus]|uniref:four helix bundle protein n=1 Tax=Nonlabens agnitus TaxID=870484 RepID=UPI001F5B46E9|nr:four helix bundle protein [Nonlabens agnitus]
MKIWKDGVDFVISSYSITNKFPESEKFNLTSQLNRCAVSIPSNIAEGSAKATDKHFKTYLETSLGSAFEWETQFIVAFKLNYVSEEIFNQNIEEIKKLQRMIGAFIDRLT